MNRALFCFILFGGIIQRRWRGAGAWEGKLCDNNSHQAKERERVKVRKASAKGVYQVCF